jgi:hypothetical protein
VVGEGWCIRVEPWAEAHPPVGKSSLSIGTTPRPPGSPVAVRTACRDAVRLVTAGVHPPRPSRHPPVRVGHLLFVSLASPGEGAGKAGESADREGAPDDEEQAKLSPSAMRRKS